MALHHVTLDDKYIQKSGRVFLTGTQALARLPMLQQELDLANDLNTACFISGYRGSPLGGLDKALWQAKKFLKEHNIHFQPGVNEELAATSVWGSQQLNLFDGAKVDGVFAMWYGKGPGVDRSGDAFKHANHAGTSKHGGVLVIAGDDHGCKSSTLPHQTEYAFIDAMIPILNPSGVQEIIDFGLYGWALSRHAGCWVSMKTIAETVDASFSVNVDTSKFDLKLPPKRDVEIRWPDKPLEQETRLHEEKMTAVLEFARLNPLNRVVVESPEPRLGIVTTGKSYLDVMQALRDLGFDDQLAADVGLSVFKVGMTWPLEPEGIRNFAKDMDEILVVEEKRGLVEDQLTSQLYNLGSEIRPVVVGKRDENGSGLLSATADLTPGVIAKVIAARLSQFVTSVEIEERLAFLTEKEEYLHKPKELIERTPHFCSGCPHNTSTVVPIGSRAMAGIGCHYMATWMDRDTDTFTQMGGEGATWIGQAPFTETDHVFQNLGDGTYFHSGLLAIRAALAAPVNITYKILYNDAVAMTGGQPVDGQLSVSQMAQQLRGEGVQRISIVSDDINKYKRAEFPSSTTFTHRDELEAVQCELREIKGTSVLIFDQTCAAEKRRRRKRGIMEDPKVRAFINSAVCEGCGDCGIASNCLSIVPEQTELGRKRKIDQSSCNKDMSCLKGFCPSFVTVVGGGLRKAEVMPVDLGNYALPDPVLPEIDQPYGIVLAGVGGTGVTTLGAILGMAAHIEDKEVSVLDMTGLAQKFGAVVSHIQVSNVAGKIHASRIAAGGAKLLIGCDLVVAASNDSLVKVDRRQAAAVINSHESMTAEFTRNADAVLPVDSMHGLISECVGADKTAFIDAHNLALRYLGNTMGSNLFMAGYAYQKGLLPLSGKAIEEAIRLNGAAVESNLKAFGLGRLSANGELSDKEHSSVNADSQDVAERSFAELVKSRREMLVRYQNESLAQRYEEQVRKIESVEGLLGAQLEDGPGSNPLSRAVAESYFKLLAYKDEYEVARFYSDPAFKKALNDQFEGNYKLKFHLSPPLIAPKDKASGLPRKITLGPWTGGLFKILAPLRFLRGTALDPFAYSADRKLERELIVEFEELLLKIEHGVSEHTLTDYIKLASLPMKIRGYGHVKRNSVEVYRRDVKALMHELENGPDMIKVIDPKAAA